MSNIELLKTQYLADLGKPEFRGDHYHPRVRHVGNWERLQSQLNLNATHQSYIDPDTLHETRNVWIWSDLHFLHKNIISFSERPYSTIAEMTEQLVANHNECVKPDDVSIWVGDVGFGNDTAINNIISACNGYKILIVGNHDFNKRRVRKLRFDEIHLLYVLPTPDIDLVLTHYPFDPIKSPMFNIHGHLHAFPRLNTGHRLQFNVNCEGHEYKPWNLNSLIDTVKLQLQCKL